MNVMCGSRVPLLKNSHESKLPMSTAARAGSRARG